MPERRLVGDAEAKRDDIEVGRDGAERGGCDDGARGAEARGERGSEQRVAESGGHSARVVEMRGGDRAGQILRRWRGRFWNCALRPSFLATKASAMSPPKNMPACQVAM